MGCAGMQADGMQEKFYDATSAYNRSLRWGDFDRAVEYVPDEVAQAFLDDHDDNSDDLVILEYELSRLNLDKQTGIGSSRAIIKWHSDRRLIVEETVVDQTWQFHAGDWVLVDERRVDGKVLPIFGEGESDVSHPYLPGLESFRDENEIGKEAAEKAEKAESRKARREARKGKELAEK